MGNNVSGRWSRMAASIAFAQAALSLAFFIFLGIYSEVVNHSFDHLSLTSLAGVSMFVFGVPAAFVVAGLGFRSGRLWPSLMGVGLELVWAAFAGWAMARQYADHDVDFLNNLPVYGMLAAGALATAVMPLLDRLPRGATGGGASAHSA